MKKLILLLIILMTTSCFAPKIALSGKYNNDTYVLETKKEYEKVWEGIIDYFAENGIPVTTIDKQSGIIISSNISFIKYSTVEENGVPRNKEAFVVHAKIENGFGQEFYPEVIKGDFNVRIKKMENGNTKINVNLVNLQATYYSTPTTYSAGYNMNIPVVSTGVFEMKLLNMFK